MRRKTVLLGAATSALFAAALIGWMHTPMARPVLAAFGVHCPADAATADQLEGMRRAGLADLRGDKRAPARPALRGLTLDASTEADARGWARAHGAACDAIERGYHFLRCRGVDAAAIGLAGPAISELWLSFDGSSKLIGVDVYRRGMDASQLAASWTGAVEQLRAQLGAPTLAFGDASPAALSAMALQTARVQYRYADYVATLTAANLPQTGLALREQYLSARL